MFVLVSCSDQPLAYLTGNSQVRRELRTLITSLDEETSEEERFVTTQRILALYFEEDDFQRQLLFLTTYVESNPNDMFNAYYLLVVAEYYRETGAYPFARYYYERIVKNHPDLLLGGEHSIHKICLTNLIDLVDEAEIRVEYYKELISRFGEGIDRGRLAYDLAKTYEQLGEWDLAMQFYKEYLNYPETFVPGEPNVRDNVSRLVTLYDLPNKNWTFDRLEDAITAIQRAIWAQNPRYLNDLRSKVGFFARAWEDAEPSSTLSLVADLGIYLKSRIRIPADLDRDSNEQEAYLATYGWGFRIPTWYLYFRRLDFPADPSVHGQWEWAGIYLGEKPY